MDMAASVTVVVDVPVSCTSGALWRQPPNTLADSLVSAKAPFILDPPATACTSRGQCHALVMRYICHTVITEQPSLHGSPKEGAAPTQAFMMSNGVWPV